MKEKVCEFCGTKYDRKLSVCPLCGKGGEDENEAVGGKSADRIPQWMWILTCVLLGLAVVIGFVYFVVSMKTGISGAVEPVVSAPVVEEPVQVEPEIPVVEVEEETLSCTELFLSQDELLLEEEGGHVFLTVVPKPLCTLGEWARPAGRKKPMIRPTRIARPNPRGLKPTTSALG